MGGAGKSEGPGGIGGSGTGGQPSISAKPGHARLGPVVGATIKVYDILDLDKLLCSAKSVESENIEDAGLFQLPDDCIEADKVYLVVASGGWDIDVDDDLVIDLEPTPVTGQFRSVIVGEWMQADNWQITAMTESLYESLRHKIETGLSKQELIEILDRVVPQFLKEDINGDDVINGRDLLDWNPQKDFDKVYGLERLQDLTGDIHQDLNGTVKLPFLSESIVGHFDTLSKANHVIVENNLAFVSTDSSLLILDVSEPSAPVLVSTFSTGWIYEIVILDNIAYLALGEAGVQLVDVSEPSKPVAMGSPLGWQVYMLAAGENAVMFPGVSGVLAGSYAYILGTIDVSDPVTPEVNYTIPYNFPDSSIISTFRIEDDLLYIGIVSVESEGFESLESIGINSLGYSQLLVIDLDNYFAGLNFLGEYLFQWPDSFSPSAVVDVISSDNTAHLLLADIKFFTEQYFQPRLIDLDVSVPGEPSLLDENIAITPFALDQDSNAIYVWEGVKITLLDKKELATIGSVSLPEYVMSSSISRGGEEVALQFIEFAIEYIKMGDVYGAQPMWSAFRKLDDSYNYQSRFVVANKHAFFASHRYGLLIVALPSIGE